MVPTNDDWPPIVKTKTKVNETSAQLWIVLHRIPHGFWQSPVVAHMITPVEWEKFDNFFFQALAFCSVLYARMSSRIIFALGAEILISSRS